MAGKFLRYAHASEIFLGDVIWKLFSTNWLYDEMITKARTVCWINTENLHFDKQQYYFYNSSS